ncbi:phage tail protein [Pantoea ananatis]
MSQKYYAIVTNLGAAKIANAAALGTKLNITQMAVGDGGGTLPTPNASQTGLISEKRRAAINTLSIDPANASQVIAEQVIPETEGGFWIREMGLYDADGTLIAVCNTPETYKPALQEGSGRTQTVRMVLIVNSTDAITLKIDPSVVLATRQYVDNAVVEVKAYSDSAMKAHADAANPHGQYLQTANALSEIAGAGKTADAIKNMKLRDVFTGVTGSLRNLKISLPAPAASLSASADEVIVTSPAGSQYRISGLNKTLSLARNGAGGIDTGKMTTGYVAVYAILNPATGDVALLGTDATMQVATEIYSKGAMPEGFAASALVSIWRVSSGKFVTGYQVDREIGVFRGTLLTTSSCATTLDAPWNELDVSAIIPPNATWMEVDIAVVTGSTSAFYSSGICGEIDASKSPLSCITWPSYMATGQAPAAFFITKKQTLYYLFTQGNGIFNAGYIYAKKYRF